MVLQRVLKFFAYTVWVLIHLAFDLHLIWKRFRNFSRQFIESRSVYASPNIAKGLSKIPVHLAFSFDEQDDLTAPNAIKKIASLICWSMVAGIPYISVFDSKGKSSLPLFCSPILFPLARPLLLLQYSIAWKVFVFSIHHYWMFLNLLSVSVITHDLEQDLGILFFLPHIIHSI